MSRSAGVETGLISSSSAPPSDVLTFLIADVRGYTSFTEAHGDEAAARLATAFAEIAQEAVEAHCGTVVELRGDEALAVFSSARQALRAAVAVQLVFNDEVTLRPGLPLRVGIGLDAGEAVRVDGGYRGGALNLAARLCGQAAPGEVLASQGVLHLAGAVDGLMFMERGTLELKGLAEPVPVHRVLPAAPVGELSERRQAPQLAQELPVPLVGLTPLIGREREARALRWSWRRARRGQLGVSAIVGPAGIGKTRLAAEIAHAVWADGFDVVYGTCLGASEGIGRALAAAAAADEPMLIVLDDLEAPDPGEIEMLRSLRDDSRPLLIVAAYRDEEAAPETVRAIAEFDPALLLLPLEPLDEDGICGIARLYVHGAADAELPLARIAGESGGVPGRVHQVVSEWAHSEAARRLGDAASRTAVRRGALRVIEAELATNVLDLQRVRERARLYGGRSPADRPDECPYKGLAGFEVADAPNFFGRERLVAELIARLAGMPFLAVVGPSGSGKSSAVRAGLVPAIGAGVLPGSDGWTITIVRPGTHPSRELDRAIFASLSESARSRLCGDEGPVEGALSVLPDEERLVIVIDQFEEIFTLCRDVGERTAFVESLVAAARGGGRAMVVIALRADFYGRCAEYPELAELIGAGNVLVGGMQPSEYRRAIEEPAKRAGLRVEPALVEALVGEVVDEPGGLPLLSTTLVELWQQRDGRVLRFETYRATGGVRGAVARLAEDAYERLTPAQQVLARGILLRLSARDGDKAVLHRVPLAEFDAAENLDVGVVLDTLVRDRLLTVSEGTVEVAHEALLREWPRLRQWMEDDRESQRLRQHLIEQAREWEERGRDTGDLYRSARLVAALDWTTDHTLELNEREREFLNESRSASEREIERQRRANRRLRGLLAGVAALLVLAIGAGAVALVQRSNARHAAVAARHAAIAARQAAVVAEQQRYVARAFLESANVRILPRVLQPESGGLKRPAYTAANTACSLYPLEELARQNDVKATPEAVAKAYSAVESSPADKKQAYRGCLDAIESKK